MNERLRRAGEGAASSRRHGGQASPATQIGLVEPAGVQHADAAPNSVVQTLEQGQALQPTAGRKLWQAPATQTRSVGQAWPHAPQWRGSVFESTHAYALLLLPISANEQRVRPLGHA